MSAIRAAGQTMKFQSGFYSQGSGHIGADGSRRDGHCTVQQQCSAPFRVPGRRAVYRFVRLARWPHSGRNDQAGRGGVVARWRRGLPREWRHRGGRHHGRHSSRPRAGQAGRGPGPRAYPARRANAILRAAPWPRHGRVIAAVAAVAADGTLPRQLVEASRPPPLFRTFHIIFILCAQC